MDNETVSSKATKIIAYITGSLISVGLVIFSIYKVSQNPDDALFLSLLTSTISLYIPSPIQISSLLPSKTNNTPEFLTSIQVKK